VGRGGFYGWCVKRQRNADVEAKIVHLYDK
jgi:hypothetical protein